MASTQYIDSTVFNHFKQRIRVSALVSFLDEEIATTEEALHTAEQALIQCKRGQKERAKEDERLDIALEILEHELKLIVATKNDAHVSIADMLKREQMRKAREGNQADEEERKKLEEEMARKAGASSLSDKTRLKNADQRTAEERSFIALDLVLHPENYVDATEEDLDVYKYDTSYSTMLTKTDLQRIVVLPEALNLALPFLRSRIEITAHQILRKYLFEQGEDRLRERDSNVLGSEQRAMETVGRTLLVEKVRARNKRAKIRAQPCEILSGDEQEWLKYDRCLHPHLFFGLSDVGFEPPNVDEKAAGEMTSKLAPRRRGSDVPILPKLDQQQLLWLRGALQNEIVNECAAPFAKKKFRSMRGTEEQLIHMQDLLRTYGWDEWDAPDTAEEQARDVLEREQEKIKEKEKMAAGAAGGTQKVQFSVRLTGLKLEQFKSSWKAKNAMVKCFALQFQVPENCVIITNLSAGSVIISFEINAGPVNEDSVNTKVGVMLDDCEVRNF